MSVSIVTHVSVCRKNAAVEQPTGLLDRLLFLEQRPVSMYIQ
jgi:hypothetical protein